MPVLTADIMTPGAIALHLRWQRYAWALRRELGFPPTPMVDESVKFGTGGVADLFKGAEVGRVAADLGRDIIYMGYRGDKSAKPAQIALAYRDEGLVDWRGSLQLWAGDPGGPVLLIDRALGMRYERGERNMLVRRAGLPAGDLTRGRRVAEARVRRTARNMPDIIESGTYIVPPGADVAEHRPAAAKASVRIA